MTTSDYGEASVVVVRGETVDGETVAAEAGAGDVVTRRRSGCQ